MFSGCLIVKACAYVCVCFTSRYEAQQEACVNRARENRRGRGRKETKTKIGVYMKGTRCDSTQIPVINRFLECTLGTWWHASSRHVLASPKSNRRGEAKSLLSSFPPSIALFFSSLLLYTGSSLILSLQIYPPVFSLVIKSCQAEAGLHSIIPRSSHIWCSPEESGHNTHHLLSAKYVGEFCRIFTQSHSVPFINYHITKEAHLLCMVCCLGARSNSPL